MYFSAIYGGNKRQTVPDKPAAAQTLGSPILWISNSTINGINTITTIVVIVPSMCRLLDNILEVYNNSIRSIWTIKDLFRIVFIYSTTVLSQVLYLLKKISKYLHGIFLRRL